MRPASSRMNTGASSGHSDDQLRLMARVARMYHEHGLLQGDIARELHISQPRVSRLLKRRFQDVRVNASRGQGIGQGEEAT